MRHFLLWFLILLLAPASSLAGEKVVLASLEWPPYTGSELPMQGATSAIVREVFRAAGYDLEIRFLPWNRAIEAARMDEDVDGYFPEYPNTIREGGFLCSESVGKSPVGLAKRRSRDLKWQNYYDLERYRVGVVDGYVNSERFDQLVAAGRIQTDESVSDVLNVRKVLAGRVDWAVVDINVFKHLLMHDEWLSLRKGELRLDARLLSINDLLVCIAPGERGAEILRRFNASLAELHPMLMQEEFMELVNTLLHER